MAGSLQVFITTVKSLAANVGDWFSEVKAFFLRISTVRPTYGLPTSLAIRSNSLQDCREGDLINAPGRDGEAPVNTVDQDEQYLWTLRAHSFLSPI